jgi:hypothetical protein
MRPLIFEFKEKPNLKNVDYSIIEYSDEQNLSVVRGSQTPAISFINMDTQTITEAGTEPCDSDNELRLNLKHILDTQTTTKSIEPTDSDR